MNTLRTIIGISIPIGMTATLAVMPFTCTAPGITECEFKIIVLDILSFAAMLLILPKN